MIIDLIIGVAVATIAYLFGYKDISFFLVIAAFIPDVDIIINEGIRFIIKREKRFSISNFLDEFSYQHKRVLHHPIPVVIGAIIAWLLVDWLFSLLCFTVLVGHLIHDTADRNFDGVRWLYPLRRYFYKLHFMNGKPLIIKKTAEELLAEAIKMDRDPKTKRTFWQLIREVIKN